MRTTKKEFKNQVQQHILEGINEELTIKDVINNFYQEKYSHENERKINKYDAFKSWMLGLPSSLNVEYTNHGINQTLNKWFENVGEQYKTTDSDKEADLYYHLVTREFRNLAKKEGVDF